MKMYEDVGVNPHHLLRRHQTEMRDQLQALIALTLGTELPDSLDGRLRGPQSLSGRCEGEENLFPPPGIEPWPSIL
jgi:hypothetical protein